MTDQIAADKAGDRLPGTILGSKVSWYIEMEQPDGTWVGCTSSKTDPDELLRTLEFRENAYPDDVHRIVQVDVFVSQVNSEDVRKMVPQKASQRDETAVQSD